MIIAGIKEEVQRHRGALQHYLGAIEKFIAESPANPEIMPINKGGKLFTIQSSYLSDTWSVPHYHFGHQYRAVLEYLKEKPTEIPTRLKIIIETGSVRLQVLHNPFGGAKVREMLELHPRVIERLKEL